MAAIHVAPVEDHATYSSIPTASVVLVPTQAHVARKARGSQLGLEKRGLLLGEGKEVFVRGNPHPRPDKRGFACVRVANLVA
jgi:hypothetical protein